MKLKVDHKSVAQPSDSGEKHSFITSTVLIFAFVVIAVLAATVLWKGDFSKKAEPVNSSEFTSTPSQTESGKININTASENELMSLPGIGKKRAEAIIERRETYARFSDISEIKNVEGIGDSVFEEIKDKITV